MEVVPEVKIGMLEILFEYAHECSQRSWMCFCECGRFTKRDHKKLASGGVASCGCQRGRKCNGPGLKGIESTRLAWMAMVNRCTNKDADNYRHYGGRGISVCERWLDFANFLEDMGSRPKGTSIDRKDNNGNYCPENCEWKTSTQQMRNRSTNVVVEFEGKRGCLSEWAEWTNTRPGLIGDRLRRGWSVRDAILGKPVKSSVPTAVIQSLVLLNSHGNG